MLSTSTEEFRQKMRRTDAVLADLLKMADKNPCIDDDCGAIVSPCCEMPVLSVRGSLPLQAKCPGCDKTYIMRDLLK